MNQYGTRCRKMRKALKTACENARVRHCTHHSLRHAYATIARQKGTDIGMISKLLGSRESYHYPKHLYPLAG